MTRKLLVSDIHTQPVQAGGTAVNLTPCDPSVYLWKTKTGTVGASAIVQYDGYEPLLGPIFPPHAAAAGGNMARIDTTSDRSLTICFTAGTETYFRADHRNTTIFLASVT